MKPTSYLYDERDGRYRLYLGGISTIAGLKLLPSIAAISEVECYTDAQPDDVPAISCVTVAAAIEYISKLPDHIGVYDFSCVIESGLAFTTHDDCEAHFNAPSEQSVRDLVYLVTPTVYRERLWTTLKSNRGCYTVIDGTGQLQTYPDFDSLLESRNHDV